MHLKNLRPRMEKSIRFKLPKLQGPQKLICWLAGGVRGQVPLMVRVSPLELQHVTFSQRNFLHKRFTMTSMTWLWGTFTSMTVMLLLVWPNCFLVWPNSYIMLVIVKHFSSQFRWNLLMTAKITDNLMIGRWSVWTGSSRGSRSTSRTSTSNGSGPSGLPPPRRS